MPEKVDVERRLAKSFDAKDRYSVPVRIEVWEYVSILFSPDGSKKESVIDVQTFRTSGGLALRHVGKGRYEEPFSGLVLTSDDPDAE